MCSIAVQFVVCIKAYYFPPYVNYSDNKLQFPVANEHHLFYSVVGLDSAKPTFCYYDSIPLSADVISKNLIIQWYYIIA